MDSWHYPRTCSDLTAKRALSDDEARPSPKPNLHLASAQLISRTPLKRLTKLNFSLSPPSALRDVLLLHSLPTTGDRPTLEARVSEWTLLYNSNLDTSHPRSLPALRAKLAEAEAARKRDKEKGKDALGEKLGTSGGMKEYARERRGECERLREVARRGMKGKSGNLGQGEELEGEGKDGKGGSEGAAIVVD